MKTIPNDSAGIIQTYYVSCSFDDFDHAVDVRSVLIWYVCAAVDDVISGMVAHVV